MKTAVFHGSNGERQLVFWCPGCDGPHSFRVAPDAAPHREKAPVWGWNGDRERPTCTPSLLVWKDVPAKRCHLFLTDGALKFLRDCHHALKGLTVPLPELPPDF